MSIKNKILSIISSHPKLVTFGIGMAVTFGIGIATGLIHAPERAFASGGSCTSCHHTL
jgi:hypothetical protein